jgi:class 3 adenylate cyclase
VTFLFTDVEGSTALLRELGAKRYAAALLEHRRLLRDATERSIWRKRASANRSSSFTTSATSPGRETRSRAWRRSRSAAETTGGPPSCGEPGRRCAALPAEDAVALALSSSLDSVA